MRSLASRIFALVVLSAAGTTAANAAKANVTCKLTFTMSGWSAFYKTASGYGTITCDNGQSMKVNIRAKGGGLTFGRQHIDDGRGRFTVGKSTIEDGHGEFSGVTGIDELLGSYVSAEAHAGAVKSSQAQVMTKGEVSLALSGTGRGWDLGIAFGKLTISGG